jgi:hypothetical protein
MESGIGVVVMLDFRIPACNTQLLHIGQYYGDLPPYLTHVIQDLCYVLFFNATSVNLGEFEMQPHRLL